MASIYDIETFTTAHVWYINDVTLNSADGRIYYAIKQQNNTPSLTSTDWAGWTTYNTKVIPHFFWVPSYAPTITSEPKVNVLNFGDGYEQRTPQGVSNNLIKLDLLFDKRDEAEVTAMAHFLHTRDAQEAFAFTPPSPYASTKKFICRSWDVTMNFHGNYSLKASFEEVVE